MNKILNQQELDEMEIRIYQTYGMGKFSPKDVMDLIYTAQNICNYQKILRKTMKLLKNLLRIKSPEQKRKQTTFCYCPNCKNELIGSDSFVSDDDLVKFQCMECKSITEWLFDAPVPILIKVDGNKYYYKKEG